MSKFLREAANDVSEGNTSIKHRLRKVANIFLNSNVLSAQEAVYHALSLPLFRSTRGTVFINTSPSNERVSMLKSEAELKKLDPESTDIYQPNLITRYSQRADEFKHECLADFATKLKRKQPQQICSDDEDDEKIERAKILRFRRYNIVQDAKNYYREHIMLFMPWTNEMNEVENIDHLDVYTKNFEIIKKNRAKFFKFDENLLDDAFAEARNEAGEEEEVEEFAEGALPADMQIDILEQCGQVGQKDDTVDDRYSVPPPMDEDNYLQCMKSLNTEQREIVTNVLGNFTRGKVPFYLFLSGSAGVGKTRVIQCIYNTLMKFFIGRPGYCSDQIKILLTAPSGKAAFLIHGVTLHTAFALPVTQFGGQMPDLSNDIANTIRQKLYGLELLIIDEISMVGGRLLSRVDTRLRQIMGRNESFGGISVIVVGDLNQLPPVRDISVYQPDTKPSLNIFGGSESLWHLFKYYRLSKVMRQREQLDFVQALNNLGSGSMTQRDIALIQSRSVLEENVPDTAIRLFYRNEDVDNYNNFKLDATLGSELRVPAKDNLLGKVSESMKDTILGNFLTKPTSDCAGLPSCLRLKVGIKYMITSNLSVTDGLVNGATGVLRHISYTHNEPSVVWLEFPERNVGVNTRRPYLELMEKENICSNAVPILRKKLLISAHDKHGYQVFREQFPLVPAEALTIHKSQGQTYKSICVDFSKLKRVTRSLIYVALSRVESLSGLHIIGQFVPPKSPKPNDALLLELNRLENHKLNLCFNDLRTGAGLKIVYFNIDSLIKYFDLVVVDEWFSRADILIFAETRTLPPYIFEMPQSSLVFRTNFDNDTKQRGLICFSKNLNPVTVSNKVEKFGPSWNLTLFSLKSTDHVIITGYKSPSVPDSVFSDTLDDIMSDIKEEERVVVLGDFNYDVMDGKESALTKALHDRNLKSALPPDEPTTLLNTQIDIIFTNENTFMAGTYESYFTYHKPIFYITGT